MTPTASTTPAGRTLNPDAQRRHAETFAEFHRHGDPLVLPNAWDAGSARLVERAGAKAIATTSGGVAWSLGSSDGGGLDRERVARVIRGIVQVVSVPVTADIERGYGEPLDELAATIQLVLEAGAVGINLEDSGGDPLYTPEEMAERIQITRATADAFGVPLFVNARTDVYFGGSGELDDAVNRARVYAEAGANGIFLPGVYDLDLIRTLTAAIELPVNVMVGPLAPSIGDLAAAGVRRASIGTRLLLSAYAHIDQAARELLEQGTYASYEQALDYPDVNGLFAR
jgi:2-methylisocitrate lyase-like PEP mutase family enzyme